MVSFSFSWLNLPNIREVSTWCSRQLILMHLTLSDVDRICKKKLKLVALFSMCVSSTLVILYCFTGAKSLALISLELCIYFALLSTFFEAIKKSNNFCVGRFYW